MFSQYVDGCLLLTDFNQVKNLVVILFTLKKSKKMSKIYLHTLFMTIGKTF